jgi:hypothetical protein
MLKGGGIIATGGWLGDLFGLVCHRRSVRVSR